VQDLDFRVIEVPAPATLGLSGLALAALAATGRPAPERGPAVHFAASSSWRAAPSRETKTVPGGVTWRKHGRRKDVDS
jgi:hypothetical protein